MELERYTERAKGFLQAAQELALRAGHQRLTPEHLLKVLLEDKDGLCANLIAAAGGDPKRARAGVEAELARLPKVEGAGAGQVYMAPEIARLFDQAEQIVVRQAFRPEFLNRLDEILLFRRLSRADMTGIVALQLRQLQRLLDERKITLEVDAEARRWLAEAGYDPVYGARPLKRVIQRELQNPLALALLEGRIHDGDTVRVTASPLGLLIEPAPREEELPAQEHAAQ